MSASQTPNQGSSPTRLKPRGAFARRLLLSFGLLACITLGGLIFLGPTLLSSGQGNAWLLTRINHVFEPGRVEIRRIVLSWNRPTTLEGFVLRDASGRPVLTASVGRFERSLWDFLTRPSDVGTLTFHDAKLDLDRRSDGTLNLTEALGHVFDNPDRARDLTIRIIGGLSVSDSSLPAPVLSDAFDFSVRFAPYPRPLTWSMSLEDRSIPPLARITGKGSADRWRAEPGSGELMNLNSELSAVNWPVRSSASGTDMVGRLDVDLTAARASGRWKSTGTADLAELKLDPKSTSSLKLAWEGGLDAEGPTLAGRLSSERLGGMEGPFSVAFDGRYRVESDRIELASFVAKSPMGGLDASGTLDRPLSARELDLKGNLAPNYEALTRMLAEKVEPGASIAGRPSPWRIRGSLATPESLSAEGGIEVTAADFHGMRLGETRIRARYADGLIQVEPIDTTLNKGRLLLRPTVDLKAPDGPVVRLGSETKLIDAEVNDEVSRRVLSFVAPVLNQATRVNGYVSASIESAEFPISKTVARRADVVGEVVFRDVDFAAGPFTRELLSMVVRDPAKLDGALLRLDQPVRLSISEGRIRQQGLGLPVGSLARIELEGWVDIDRNLGMTASIPLNPELFPKVPLLNGVARATRFQIPIGGTLDNPKVDSAAFKANMGKMGRDILAETGTQGLIQLFSNLAKPRDPDAPPPPPKPTPEERRAKRMQQKAERLAKKKQKGND